MQGKFIVLHSSGKVSERELTAAPEPEELKKAVGGWIEEVPFFNTYRGERCVAFCNEEGKLALLPVNAEATKRWYAAIYEQTRKKGLTCFWPNDILVGDIVVITGDQELMEAL
jgi:hypothetical protein